MKQSQRRTRSDIDSRHTQRIGERSTLTTRFLSCGHAQAEPNGGKAHLATWAYCDECDAEKAFKAATAKPPPPLPDVQLVWERRSRTSGWWRFALAALVGAAAGAGLLTLLH